VAAYLTIPLLISVLTGFAVKAGLVPLPAVHAYRPDRRHRRGHRPGLMHTEPVPDARDTVRSTLLRRGFALEYMTLAWNIAGIVVLAIAAISARSVALAGFGLDSLIEIGASAVVIWELSGTGADRQRHGLRLIGYAFTARLEQLAHGRRSVRLRPPRRPAIESCRTGNLAGCFPAGVA
jgi:hypothetical protein